MRFREGRRRKGKLAMHQHAVRVMGYFEVIMIRGVMGVVGFVLYSSLCGLRYREGREGGAKIGREGISTAPICVLWVI